MRDDSWQSAVPLWMGKHVGVGCLQAEDQEGTMNTQLCAGLCYVWIWVEKTGAVCTRAFCGFG